MQFSQILATEGLQMSSQGIDDYFKQAKLIELEASNSISDWSKITQLAKQCRVINEQNGASINTLAQHTQRS